MTTIDDVVEYNDIVPRLEALSVEDGLTKDTREIILEAKKEIESLRNALTLFSEEFENIQKQDEQRMGTPSEYPTH